MKTSVIITVYNRPEMLMACLQALALNSGKIDEVVVSDDGSCEESVRRMKTFFHQFPFPIKYVWQKDNGFRLAAARNNGIRHSTGNYIISLDCDILLLPGAIDVHLKHAKNGWFLAANRAFLSRELSSKALERPLNVRFLQELWGQSDKSHLSSVHRQFVRNYWLRRFWLTRRHKPKILGCHFSLFRENIDIINGFDEQYVGWGLEDDNFAMRLHKAGVKGKSLIMEAHAIHLWHEGKDRRPHRLSDSPNIKYFKRQNVPAYCVNGLVHAKK